jgi:sec-independent protein translocase protein TatA
MSPLFAFMMPGPTEMVVIGVIAVLLFGRKLPKLAFDLGNSFTQFKKGISEPMAEASAMLKGETDDVAATIKTESADFTSTVRKESAAMANVAK